MPDLKAEMDRIEERIRHAEHGLMALLKAADVNFAQWSRWRAGLQRPLRSTWRRIEDAADKLAPRRGR